jgi:hypothetical protein
LRLFGPRRAREYDPYKLATPQIYLWRMIIFLIIAGFIALILYRQVYEAFLANPGLNGVIIAVLMIGIVLGFRQVLRLFPEIRWVNTFRVAEPGVEVERPPVLLAPMATLLGDRIGRMAISTQTMRSILDSILMRLDEDRDMSRYLVSLLIFLGLLGTFWGLLQTVSTVGATIGTLDTNAGDNVLLFDQLKEGLAGPLKGMGTAFSASMFGLSGSLILGFLDLQAGHAQGRFYNELEDWLSGITELQLADAPGAAGVAPQVRFALLDMQRSLADLNDKVEMKMLNDNTGDAVKDLAAGVDKLIRQMRAEQKVVREWADEQAQQQHELAAVLRQITDKAKLPAREERK